MTPNRELLHDHLLIDSESAPSYALARDRKLGVTGPKESAVYILYDAVLALGKLPPDTLVHDRRVHAILDNGNVNYALGVLIAEAVHPKSHFPGPIVCFRDKIVAIRRAADETERGDAVNVESKLGLDPSRLKFDRVFDVGRVSGTLVVDYRNGMTQQATVTGPTTISLDPVPPQFADGVGVAPTLTLAIVQDEVGGRAVEWDASIKWKHDQDGLCYPIAMWRTFFRVYCLPGALCAENVGSFEP